jgi:hypothetical protein
MAKRRFGRVRKFPSSRYQARYSGPDGVDRPAPQTFASKTDADVWLTIRRPVLFGENGKAEVNYEIDAFHDDLGVAVEVEAGRGAYNNADYRDIVRTSLILDARNLALLMPVRYRSMVGQRQSVSATRSRWRTPPDERPWPVVLGLLGLALGRWWRDRQTPTLSQPPTSTMPQNPSRSPKPRRRRQISTHLYFRSCTP